MLEARYRLAGDNVRAYADKRREEMDRRKLRSRQLIGTADDEN